jgi:hypothetical protein
MTLTLQPRVSAPGELLRKQFESLRRYAAQDGMALLGQAFRTWYTPEKESWSGGPFDLTGLQMPFSRAQHEQEFDSAVANAANPGTVGDLAASQLQGDLLASLERAYRSRLRTSVRNKMHAAARRIGQGNTAGPIIVGMQNYIERIIKGSQT